jgi:hypothetical protein
MLSSKTIEGRWSFAHANLHGDVLRYRPKLVQAPLIKLFATNLGLDGQEKNLNSALLGECQRRNRPNTTKSICNLSVYPSFQTYRIG